MLFKIEMGDYAGASYSVHEAAVYETNYPLKDIAEAYRKSCRKYGIQFNDPGENFTGLELTTWDMRVIWSDPDTCKPDVDEKLRDLLIRIGLMGEDDFEPVDNAYGKGYRITIYDWDECADIIMRFIALSMPDDFEYSYHEQEDIPCLNDELHVTDFGYALLVP